MKRLTYIYWATPLFVLLGCGPLFERLMGEMGALVVGLLLVLSLWAVAWLRLYGMNRLRPEFAVLMVLPQAVYYIARALPSEQWASFDTVGWQNLYFFCWLGAVAVGLLSLRPGWQDTRRSMMQDAVFLLMAVLFVLFSLSTWASCAGELFSI